MMKSTLIAAVMLAACSQGSLQSGTCSSLASTAPVTKIGAFSSMRYTEEHQYGEAVLLWRSGNCTFGLFQSAQGLQGDTPIGELHDVAHNPTTGELKFSAKLTLGVTVGPTSRAEQPSRDLFTFVGALSPALVTGVLTHATLLDARSPARNIDMAFSTTEGEVMSKAATYGAWRAQWEPILKRRGPRW
jgi:hypothetical protein